MKRKQARIIMLCIIMMIGTFCIAPIKAHAEEKVYNVNYAEFDITLSETGTATVTEHWNVTYSSGNFTRFYKDIFIPGNQLEYFSEINVLDCNIDGQKATATTSLDRIDYHYFFELGSSQLITVHWFKAAHDQMVDYDITYEIPNAVKLDENDEAEYCYRLIGANFPKTVGMVSTTIHIPDIDAVNESAVSMGEFTRDGDALYCTQNNIGGVYKVRLKMKKDCFGDLQRIASVEVPAGFSEDETISTAPVYNTGTRSSGIDITTIILVIGALVLPIGSIFLLIIIGVVSAVKAKKFIKNNPSGFIESAQHIQSSGMPYLWYTFKETGISGNVSCAFYTELIDLRNKGYLSFTYDGIKLNDNSSGIQYDKIQLEKDMEFILLLEKYFPISKGLDGSYISFDQVKYTSTGNTSMYASFSKWVTDYRSKLKDSSLYMQLSQSGILDSLKPDFKVWSNYAMYNKTLRVDVNSCISMLVRNENVNAYIVLQMMQDIMHTPSISSSSSHSDASGAYGFYFINYFNDSCRAATHTSGSSGSGGGCSSCSSCSSCSGCGGGGAD